MSSWAWDRAELMALPLRATLALPRPVRGQGQPTSSLHNTINLLSNILRPLGVTPRHVNMRDCLGSCMHYSRREKIPRGSAAPVATQGGYRLRICLRKHSDRLQALLSEYSEQVEFITRFRLDR
ncbi:hypothetical protein BDV41DRAFT_133609 [Aspergillus transmontanensis]|uniref:Uncharacterized protein n=1 Tax=Aspergillus transmontanensis TaxID=1034304 RepID=A0A5N6W5E9_9EURO|nr:hypothetical protein BDV41DRAFT_133609 [Aspergillus transmontanensis]